MEAACTFNLNNQNYIIGGRYNQKQVQSNIFIILVFLIFKISIVNGCSLQRISDMPIDSWTPACASFDFKNESFVLVCFAEGYRHTCYK